MLAATLNSPVASVFVLDNIGYSTDAIDEVFRNINLKPIVVCVLTDATDIETLNKVLDNIMDKDVTAVYVPWNEEIQVYVKENKKYIHKELTEQDGEDAKRVIAMALMVRALLAKADTFTAKQVMPELITTVLTQPPQKIVQALDQLQSIINGQYNAQHFKMN